MTTATVPDVIDHIAISVDDIASSVEWYQKQFRCSIEYQDSTWALLGFGNVRLALVIAEQHPPHIGIVTPDAEKYGELKMHRDGTRSTYISDPSGNAVELLAPYDAD